MDFTWVTDLSSKTIQPAKVSFTNLWPKEDIQPDDKERLVEEETTYNFL